MTQEIHIHRNVKHPHIVGFESYFEDSDNVYVILELCRRRVSDVMSPKINTKLSVRVTSQRILLSCVKGLVN